MNISNLNMITIAQAWYDNRQIIQDYLNGSNHIENYVQPNYLTFPPMAPMTPEDRQNLDKGLTILGMTVGIFIIVALVMLFCVVYSVYLLIKYWKTLSGAAKVTSIILLFFFPPISVAILLASKPNKKS